MSQKETKAGEAPKKRGRPRLPKGQVKVTYANKLPQDVVTFLKSCSNASGLIEKQVKKSAEYKLYVKSRRK